MATTGSSRRAARDLLAILFGSAVVFAFLAWIDAIERIAGFSRAHESWQMNELVTLALVLAIAGAIYSYRRWQDLKREMAQRARAEEEARVLRGLLPICSSCKKIRDASGAWTVLETYIVEHSAAEFTHGICPDCRVRLYPGLTP